MSHKNSTVVRIDMEPDGGARPPDGARRKPSSPPPQYDEYELDSRRYTGPSAPAGSPPGSPRAAYPPRKQTQPGQEQPLWVPVMYQSLSAEVQNEIERMSVLDNQQNQPAPRQQAPEEDDAYQVVSQLSLRRKHTRQFQQARRDSLSSLGKNQDGRPALPLSSSDMVTPPIVKRKMTPAAALKERFVNIGREEKFDIDVVKEATVDDHVIPLEELEKRFETDIAEGLSEKQVADRIAKDGKNVLTPPKQPSIIIHFIKCLVGGFAVVLWIAFFLCIIAYKPLGDPPDIYNLILGVVILFVIIIQGTFFFVEERKSNTLMKSFATFLPTKCQVLRDGDTREVDASELVVGDIVSIKGGDRVPADMRLIEVNQAKVEKSGLTGESEPIALSVQVTDSNIYETKNVALFGTSILEGTATGVVINTGDRTIMGKIARVASSTSSASTGLQKEINYTTGMLAAMALALILIVVLGYYFGIDPNHPGYLSAAVVVTTCIGCVVSLLPDGMPVALATILTLVAKRMYKIKILVKKLTVLETLGSATLIASDKTGTLTQNRMTLNHIWLDTEYPNFDSPSKDEMKWRKVAAAEEQKEKSPRDLLEETVGGCLAAKNISNNLGDPMLSFLTQAMGLCNKTVFDREENPRQRQFGLRKVIGSPTEGALLNAADEYVNLDRLRSSNPIVGEIAFTSRTKYHMTIHRVLDKAILQSSIASIKSAAAHEDFHHIVLVKGAPEYIMGMCAKAVVNGVEVNMDSTLINRVMKSNESMASFGERVLGFGYRKLNAHEYPEKFEFDMEDEERWTTDFTFLGLTGIIDPPREGVAEAIDECHIAHIRVMMVTGDHPSTATAIARMVNIVTRERVKTIADVHREVPKTTEDQIEAIEENRWTKKLKDLVKPAAKRNFKDEALVINGGDLGELTRKQWDYILEHREVVFARTTPQQKLQIVKESRKRGDTVAVTGDGVNDAPALKAANLGVAMGICGSDVSKEAANMILLDDNFVTIVKGIKEGRLLFDNLKKLICYLFPSGSFSEILPVLAAVFFGVPLPLTSFHMIVICVGTDMTGSLGMIHELAEADLMRRPPRSKNDRLVNLRTILFAYFFIGIMESAIGFFMYFYTMAQVGVYPRDLVFAYDLWKKDDYISLSVAERDRNVNKAQCAFFVALVMCQLWNLLASRTRYQSILTQKFQPKILLYMLAQLMITLMVIYLPLIQQNLHTEPLEYYHFLIPLAMGSIILIMDEIRKFFVRRYPKGILAKLAW